MIIHEVAHEVTFDQMPVPCFFTIGSREISAGVQLPALHRSSLNTVCMKISEDSAKFNAVVMVNGAVVMVGPKTVVKPYPNAQVFLGGEASPAGGFILDTSQT